MGMSISFLTYEICLLFREPKEVFHEHELLSTIIINLDKYIINLDLKIHKFILFCLCASEI